MKKASKRGRPDIAEPSVDELLREVDLELNASRRQALGGVDAGVRRVLSAHLHDVQNTLWPAALRIELLLSEELCPPKFREALQELAGSLSEAMAITALASNLVDLAPVDLPPVDLPTVDLPPDEPAAR